MKIFFRFVLGYLLGAFLLAAVARGEGMELVGDVAIATFAFSTEVAQVVGLLVPVMIVLVVLLGWRRIVTNFGDLGYAIAASALLQTAFCFVKSTIPMIVPFYADQKLADLDRWMHGGVDAWKIAHRIGAYLPMDAILPMYLSVWIVPAVGLAVILAAVDNDRERKARFLMLYLFCWIVLGNVLAILGSSVGPVYYDAAFGGDRFAELNAALAQTGVATSRVGLVQNALWQSYSEGGMAIGSGISAFPSVHVGIATLTALYLAERSRWLVPVGLAFVGTILFLSVYTGYHYALDGYVSILLITGAWVMLRRVDLTAMGATWLLRPQESVATARQG